MITGETALSIIKKAVFKTLGCTDPVAIALAAATAYKQVGGEIKSVSISMDKNIYKNGVYVGIPGTNRKGIKYAVALGLVGGNLEKGLLLLDDVCDQDLKRGQDLFNKDLIHLSLNSDADRVHIEAEVVTSNGKALAVIDECHDNIILIKRNGDVVLQSFPKENSKDNPSVHKEPEPKVTETSISEIIEIIEQIPQEELEFLKEGVETNLRAAEVGLEERPGMQLGYAMQKMLDEGVLPDSFNTKIKIAASAAADARMGGVKVPIIGCGGSGNHGITFFISVGMAHRYLNIPEEVSLTRALALGLLIIVAIKDHTGVLTPICGCAVAAGAGATAAITYLLGGGEKEILGAINLLLGNLSGLVCDGAKYGCSLKINTSVGVVVESALLAMRGTFIPDSDGIIGSSLKESLHNLGVLHKRGMKDVDQTILDIILSKEGDAF